MVRVVCVHTTHTHQHLRDHKLMAQFPVEDPSHRDVPLVLEPAAQGGEAAAELILGIKRAAAPGSAACSVT